MAQASMSPAGVADLACYIVTAYAVTWVVVAPLVRWGLGAGGAEAPEALHVIGAIGPAVGAGWLVGLCFGSVWLAVLHNGTDGSVLACMLWHATYDLAATIGGQVSVLVPALVSATVIVGTIVAVRRVGVTDLAHHPRFAIADRS